MIVAVVIAIKPEKNSGLQLVLRDAKYKNTGATDNRSWLLLVLTDDYYLLSYMDY